MRELSLHILDIVQNSIGANANLIEIKIVEDLVEDILSIEIIDNGSGIKEDILQQITDPFVTSRTTREVGLGLSLLKQAARRCGGDMKIESVPGKGTSVKAIFGHSHLDRAPLGDIGGTLISLITTKPDLDFIYEHFIIKQDILSHRDRNQFKFSTKEFKEELEDVSINNPQILNWIEGYLKEGFNNLYGGD